VTRFDRRYEVERKRCASLRRDLRTFPLLVVAALRLTTSPRQNLPLSWPRKQRPRIDNAKQRGRCLQVETIVRCPDRSLGARQRRCCREEKTVRRALVSELHRSMKRNQAFAGASNRRMTSQERSPLQCPPAFANLAQSIAWKTLPGRISCREKNVPID
jgi:hypothetical protein